MDSNKEILIDSFQPSTQVNDLPDLIRAELSRVLKQVQTSDLPLQMLWLFGSHGQGQTSSPGGMPANLDLLLILDQGQVGGGRARKRQKNKMLRALEKDPMIESQLHVLFEQVEVFHNLLAKNDTFYGDIVRSGRLLLHDGQPLLLPRGQDRPLLRRKRSETFFNRYYSTAQAFHMCYVQCLRVEHHALALFQLHQMCELLLNTVQMVYCFQRSKQHDLRVLRDHVASYLPEILDVMPDMPYVDLGSGNPNHRRADSHVDSKPDEDSADRRGWRLMQAAYLGARYDAEFVVDSVMVESMANKVAHVQSFVYEVCVRKVQSYCPQLPWEPPPEKGMLNE